MKILHVVSNYHPAHGGPQYTMKHLSEKMVAWHNDEVTVATSNSLYGPEQTYFKKINPANENLNGVLIKRFFFYRWHFKLIHFASKVYGKIYKKPLPHSIRKYKGELHCPGIEKEMSKTDADIIMATTINYMFSDYPFWRHNTKKPKPFVLYGALHLHINWPKDSPMIARAKNCDCYIANTEYERVRLIEYGVDANKIVTIGTGIAIDDMKCDKSDSNAFRTKHNIATDDVLIGHIGRLSKGKGAGVLLDAFIKLYKKNKQVKLLLAGTETEYAIELKEKINTHNVPVIFLDNFTDKQKPVLFNALDIFVLASTGESFGVVFLEAWACKKPVVGANVGAVASLLSNEKDSLLFESNNADSLYVKIKILVDDKNKRNEFGQIGYNKVQQHFTWQRIVEKYKKAYELGIENFNKINKA